MLNKFKAWRLLRQANSLRREADRAYATGQTYYETADAMVVRARMIESERTRLLMGVGK